MTPDVERRDPLIGVSAASGLLGKPGTYQRPIGSWHPSTPYQKLKSLRIWPTIFRELPHLYFKNPTSNLRWSTSGLNWLFTVEIPSISQGSKSWSGKFPTFPSGGYDHGAHCNRSPARSPMTYLPGLCHCPLCMTVGPVCKHQSNAIVSPQSRKGMTVTIV